MVFDRRPLGRIKTQFLRRRSINFLPTRYAGLIIGVNGAFMTVGIYAVDRSVIDAIDDGEEPAVIRLPEVR
jgi:hypothetical protein